MNDYQHFSAVRDKAKDHGLWLSGGWDHEPGEKDASNYRLEKNGITVAGGDLNQIDKYLDSVIPRSNA